MDSVLLPLDLGQKYIFEMSLDLRKRSTLLHVSFVVLFVDALWKQSTPSVLLKIIPLCLKPWFSPTLLMWCYSCVKKNVKHEVVKSCVVGEGHCGSHHLLKWQLYIVTTVIYINKRRCWYMHSETSGNSHVPI